MEAAYEELMAQQRKMLQNYVDETPPEEKMLIPAEELERLLEEVMRKDGLEDATVAQEFFDGLWEKMQKFKLREWDYDVIKPEFLSEEQKDIYAEYLENPNEYRSYAVDEFLLDNENYEKRHHW